MIDIFDAPIFNVLQMIKGVQTRLLSFDIHEVFMYNKIIWYTEGFGMNFIRISHIKDIFPICLGSDCFGSLVSESDSFAMMDWYAACGGNIIDTARMYAVWIDGMEGKSEETIGKWMKKRNMRNKMIISTKCAHPSLATMDVPRLSLAEIEQDIDKSLRALMTDYIDICFLHRDSNLVPVEEIIYALNRMVKKGKIRTFGCSNWKSDRIIQADAYAKMDKLQSFVASQIKWSLAKTNPQSIDDTTLVEMDQQEYTFYKDSGMCVFAYAPQAKGFFTTLSLGGKEALSPKALERYMSKENEVAYEKALKIAADMGKSVTAVILSYLMSTPHFPVLPIVGCKNITQLQDSLGAVDLSLGTKTLSSLSTLA